MVTLTTGTDVEGYGDVIGINDVGEIFGGYDQTAGLLFSATLATRGTKLHTLTADERRELAEVMIARWAKFGGVGSVAEDIANMIEAHAVNPQVAVETKITDSERDVAIRECAAIARMATAQKKPGQA